MQNKHKVVLVPMDKAGWTKHDVLKCVKKSQFNEVGDIGIADFDCDNTEYMQPHQLLIVKQPEITQDYDPLNVGSIKKCEKYLHTTCTGKAIKTAKEDIAEAANNQQLIIAAYPKLEGIATIELSDIKEMERRGWPDSVELNEYCRECKFTKQFHNGFVKCSNNNWYIVINWEPEIKPEIVENTDAVKRICTLALQLPAEQFLDLQKWFLSYSKPEIVEGGVMTVQEWAEERDKVESDAMLFVKSEKIIGLGFDLAKEYAEYYHQQKTKWIKCSEQLPEPGQFVLIPGNGEKVVPSVYESKEFYRFIDHCAGDRTARTYYHPVEMWRPFPDSPYKQQSNAVERSVATEVPSEPLTPATKENLGVECHRCHREPATKYYGRDNTYPSCDHCYEKLNDEFDEGYK